MTTLGVTSRSRAPSRTREPWTSSSESRVVAPSALIRVTRRPLVVGSIWKKATSPGASVPVLGAQLDLGGDGGEDVARRTRQQRPVLEPSHTQAEPMPPGMWQRAR